MATQSVAEGGMLESAAKCHPSLARAGQACQGIYTPKEHFHKQNAQCNYISIGDVRISFACQRPSAPQPGTRPSTASPLGC